MRERGEEERIHTVRPKANAGIPPCSVIKVDNSFFLVTLKPCNTNVLFTNAIYVSSILLVVSFLLIHHAEDDEGRRDREERKRRTIYSVLWFRERCCYDFSIFEYFVFLTDISGDISCKE